MSSMFSSLSSSLMYLLYTSASSLLSSPAFSLSPARVSCVSGELGLLALGM